VKRYHMSASVVAAGRAGAPSHWAACPSAGETQGTRQIDLPALWGGRRFRENDMTPTDEMLDAADEPFQALKIMLLVLLMVLAPLAMAALAVWLLVD
jgi:hypothetical protein